MAQQHHFRRATHLRSLEGERYGNLGFQSFGTLHASRLQNPKAIDQSHRYGRHQAACREPAGSYDKTTRTAICYEHKMQYLLIRAPYTRIVVFWHISNIPNMISQSQISCNTPHVLYSCNIYEILLYNRQLVVITHDLIYGVRAAIR